MEQSRFLLKKTSLLCRFFYLKQAQSRRKKWIFVSFQLHSPAWEENTLTTRPNFISLSDLYVFVAELWQRQWNNDKQQITTNEITRTTTTEQENKQRRCNEVKIDSPYRFTQRRSRASLTLANFWRENQISIIRRTKGRRTILVKIHQLYSAKK